MNNTPLCAASELVRETERFLRKTFSESAYFDAHPAQRDYRLEHSYRVANLGRELALREGFDADELTAACLLHDISYHTGLTDDAQVCDHGRSSARIARRFLTQLGLPEARIADICYGIAIHVDDKADFDGVRTPFALSVGDADNLDRFDAYRLYETLERRAFSSMPLAQKRAQVAKVLERLAQLREMPLGTPTAVLLWQQRLDFMTDYYGRLQLQLERSDAIYGASSAPVTGKGAIQ